MVFNKYSYGLSLTSQFYFCGLPLRLDTYSKCGFGCTYCFARARGGNYTQKSSISDPEALRRRFVRLFSMGKRPKSVLDEFILRRVPIHFGGMTDPFSHIEAKLGISLRYLEILSEFNYPTVISTKSDILCKPGYLELLQQGNFLVQISIISLDQNKVRNLEKGVPEPVRLCSQIDKLSSEGVNVAIRLQPFIIGFEEDAKKLIRVAREIGVKHISFEHLKVPMEKGWDKTELISSAIGKSIKDAYIDLGAVREGREWVLPRGIRIKNILYFRNLIKKAGMTFGSGDNDFMLLSDTDCCCTGADQYLKGMNTFSYNYTWVIREAYRQRKKINISMLEKAWCPTHTIDKYVNSKSRLASSVDGGLAAYIQKNWNGAGHGWSPGSYFGVKKSIDFNNHIYGEYEFDYALLDSVMNLNKAAGTLNYSSNNWTKI